MLNLQAKEKGLELIFDVHEKQHANIIESKDYNNEILTLQDSNTRSGKLNEIIVDKDEKGYIPAYLTCNDFINIDPYKMNQVISNIVSNAIKFTPVGQTVTIKARKIIPDQRVTQIFSISNSDDHEKRNNEDNQDISALSQEKIEKENYFRNTLNYILSHLSINTSNNEYDIEAGNHIHENKIYNGKISEQNDKNLNSSLKIVQCGYLLVEVSDSGVGMAPENSKRLFKEIVQFNPSKLQVSCNEINSCN